MKKLFSIGFLIFILFGCASTSSSSANSNASGMDLDAAIREAAAQMEIGIPSGTTIALVSVASPSTAFSTQVLTRLESVIVSGRKLIVVDRANLDKVRTEQGFQLSGEVSDESAKAIGKLLGAGAIVTGSLTDLGDVYSLTLKAINIETATVAVSYLADLAKTRRIETLVATRDVPASGGATVARTQTATTTSTAQTTPAPVVPPTPAYKIGDTGPAGGIIFYDKGNDSGGWRYMEAAPADLGTTVWATEVITVDEIQRFGFRVRVWNEVVSDRGNRAVGMGKSNTEHLVRIANNRGGGFGWAVKAVDAYELNGFDGWFLPSQDELNYMYGNLHMKGLGNFRSERYWSSSMGHDTRWTGVLFANFSNGEVNTALQDNGTPPTNYRTARFLVRPVRQF